VKRKLLLQIRPQPTDATCGPTCLHAVYRYYGDAISLKQVVEEVQTLETGGTLAVQLACHALRRGYSAHIYTYNLEMFDPSWFQKPGVVLKERLKAQAAVKKHPKLRVATEAYLEFCTLGGLLTFQELSPGLIRRHLDKGRPVLTGLSATYLYGCEREYGAKELEYDDVRGNPVGHFVVLCGYDRKRREVLVADPLQDNPRFGSHYYSVGVQRVLGSILLGVLTYDANFLLLTPLRSARKQR